MDTKTGRIYDAEQLEKLRPEVKERLIPVPEEKLAALQGMNRAQRRAWAKQEKKRLARKRKN